MSLIWVSPPRDFFHGGGIPFIYNPVADTVLVATTETDHRDLIDGAYLSGISPDIIEEAENRCGRYDTDTRQVVFLIPDGCLPGPVQSALEDEVTRRFPREPGDSAA